MKKNGVHKTQPHSHANEKRETALTVPDESENQQRAQKEKAVAEQPTPAPAMNGSVPVSER